MISYISKMCKKSFFSLIPALLLFQACSKTPSTLEEYIDQGDRQLDQGKIIESIASYRLALFQDTLNPIILARLSRAYSARGNPVAADRYLRKAVNIIYGRGIEALQAGDDTAAVVAFEQTLQIHPSHPLALNRLGDIYQARGQEEKAIQHFEKSAEIQPDFAETFLRLGQLYISRRETDKAQKAFERAIEANINATNAYMGLGEIFLQEKNWGKAADNFNNALLIQPHSAAARKGLEKARQHL